MTGVLVSVAVKPVGVIRGEAASPANIKGRLHE
jgi:hypothetical protein